MTMSPEECCVGKKASYGLITHWGGVRNQSINGYVAGGGSR